MKKNNIVLTLILVLLIGLCFYTHSVKFQNVLDTPDSQVVPLSIRKKTSALDIITRSNTLNQSDDTVENYEYVSNENTQYKETYTNTNGNVAYENPVVINNNTSTSNSITESQNQGVSTSTKLSPSISTSTNIKSSPSPSISSSTKPSPSPSISTSTKPSPSQSTSSSTKPSSSQSTSSSTKPSPSQSTSSSTKPSSNQGTSSNTKPNSNQGTSSNTKPNSNQGTSSSTKPNSNQGTSTSTKPGTSSSTNQTSKTGVAGKLYLPTINHSVTIYYANIYDDGSYNAQKIVDAVDSAAYYQFGGKYIIADHNYQGFSKIGGLKVGDIAYIRQTDGTRKNYVLKRKLIGRNTGTDLKDKAGNSISTMEGSLAMYTCYILDGEIVLTLWDEV